MLTKKKLLRRVIELEKKAATQEETTKKVAIGLAGTAAVSAISTVMNFSTRSAVQRNNEIVISKLNSISKTLSNDVFNDDDEDTDPV